MSPEPIPSEVGNKPELGFNKTTNTLTGGVVLRNGKLLPLMVLPRYRSKYSPHQGLRECIRRLKQQPPTTVDHTL